MRSGRRGRFLFVIWHAGGGTQPMLGLARLLAAAGNEVHVLGPETHRSRAEAARAAWHPLPPECDFDAASGPRRALEDRWEDFVKPMLWGSFAADALLDAAERFGPDVVVVDQQLRSTLSAAERVPARRVAFAHTAFRFHGVYHDGWAGEDLAMTNAARARLALEPLALDRRPVGFELMRRADRVLVAMTPEFDPWEEPLANAVHIGPLFEDDPASARWASPWPDDHPEPLVVVSLSSQYMHQEDLFGRIGTALGELPVRLLLLLGFELDETEIRPPANAVVERYVPHLAVLPRAAAVVTHGGMGTIMAAFACGVPAVCVPLGRDQEGNARRVEELGAGLALPADAEASVIRDAVLQALESETLRAGSRRMAGTVARYGDGERAVAELEPLLT